MTEPAKKAAKATATAKKAARSKVATTDTSKTPTKRAAKKVSVKNASSTGMFRDRAAITAIKTGRRQRPPTESVDEETIARLIAELESGIPSEKLRRRGRPAIGDEAASTYSVRLPDDLVSLVDGRSEIDGVTRAETIRRALIDYLTK